MSTTTTTSDRDRWMDVIGYEVWMLGETLKIGAPEGPLRNAISESRVLHARNLCDFCSPPWRPTDIKPADLFTPTESGVLGTLVGNVVKTYLTDAYPVLPPDGTSAKRSPKWVFDKMLAHPTQDRGTSFNPV